LKDPAHCTLGKRFFHQPDRARPVLSIDDKKSVDADRSNTRQDFRGGRERLVGLGAIDGRLDELGEAERRPGRPEVVRLPNDVEEFPELALRRRCDILIEPRCQIAPERGNDFSADQVDLGTAGRSVQNEGRRIR
jgi:hypothetical protein